MNLIIDLGNTAAKVALFCNEELVRQDVLNEASVEALTTWLQDDRPIKAILSTVVHHAPEFEAYLAENFQYLRFSHQTPLPIQLDYKTPETLGLDRIANAVAVAQLEKGKPGLAIDIGTCIKYDFVDENDHYRGGAIAPGFSMRFKALNTFTDKLPLIEETKIDHVVGKSTKESIASGVYNGVAFEIQGMIDSYRQQYPTAQIAVTGGDAYLFDIGAKNTIFADVFLTLKGLNQILRYNG